MSPLLDSVRGPLALDDDEPAERVTERDVELPISAGEREAHVDPITLPRLETGVQAHENVATLHLV